MSLRPPSLPLRSPPGAARMPPRRRMRLANTLTPAEKAPAGCCSSTDDRSTGGAATRSPTPMAALESRGRHAHAAVRHGSGHAAARDIVSKDTFEQFELVFDWRVAPGGNSGIKYFVLEDRNVSHRPRVPADRRRAARGRQTGPHRQTAAFYDVLPAADRPIKPAGEWNTTAYRRPRAERRTLAERKESAPVPAGNANAESSDPEEQVQGRRALRHAAERAHPAAGSR